MDWMELINEIGNIVFAVSVGSLAGFVIAWLLFVKDWRRKNW
ncbi:hypothetical protein LCGC14_2206580 [marine sediment metagenome]|uniref:Uncharacterized protein n=1 Tax=marine sediment metagenome TaxID=412755 RepID=A0A0F9E2I8_9ZZZZ